jgi:preprotein translocase subunit SecF
MINLIDPEKRFSFHKAYKYNLPVSIALVLFSVFLVIKGLNYGVDFKGGAEVLVHWDQRPELSLLRDTLNQEGFQGYTLQTVGEEQDNYHLVKIPGDEENLNQLSDQMSKTLTQKLNSFGPRIDKIDIVGPKAGRQLRVSGFQAMLWALVAIMVYISLRFDFKYAPGAIVALFHDVAIILGVFGILQLEFTLQIVAALLAVIGYSVNDTVVIFDRIREHEDRYPERALKENINNAVSETLTRTFLTSTTTLFISVAMYFFGGESIKDFFLAISIGVVVGTYSSVFVASPCVLLFDRLKGEEKRVKA